MTDLAKAQHLIEVLLTKTEHQRLKWREGVDGVTFATSVGAFHVFVAELDSEDTDGADNGYLLDIATAEGRIKETIRSERQEELARSLRRLHQAAKLSARGDELVVEELLTALQSA